MITNKDVRYSNPSNAEQTAHKPRYSDELTLYVKNIPKTMGKADLQHLFGPYGDIENIYLVTNDVYPSNRAYVTMKSKEAGQAAVDALNGWNDGAGTRIYVNFKQDFGSRNAANTTPPHNAERGGYSKRGKSLPTGLGRGNTLLKAAGFPGNTDPAGRPPAAPFAHTNNYHKGGGPQLYRPPARGNIASRGQGGFRGRGRGGVYGAGYSSRGGHSSYRGGYSPYRGGYSPSKGGYGGEYPQYDNSPYYQNSHSGDAGDFQTPPPLQKIGKCLQCSTTSHLRCSSCKVAPYCSRECQTKHWNDSHKMECSKMRDQALSSPVAHSKATVGVDSRVLEAMRLDPAIRSVLEELQGSDTESVSSSMFDGLTLNESIQVRLTDFVSPSQFFVQLLDDDDVPGQLPRVWECGLHGITPSGGGKWSSRVIGVLASNGLALGGLCTITCVKRRGRTYRAKVVLRNGADLSEKLVLSGLAQPMETELARSAEPRTVESTKTGPAGPSNTEPAKPSNIKKAKPSNSEPAKPSNSEPAKPSNSKPAKSSNLEPAKLLNSEPAKPSNLESAMSPVAEPVKPPATEPVISTGKTELANLAVETESPKAAESRMSEKEEDSKYKVSESLHTRLEPGQTVQIVIDESSVRSVSDFYAQVAGKIVMEELRLFSEMEPKLYNYAAHIANKPPHDYKAEENDYVLAPFEGGWFRGLVTASNETAAAVAFIDYGNISVVGHKELMPIPKQFCDVPAISAQCRLHGLAEAVGSEEQTHAITQIRALAGDRIKAIVRSVTDMDISLDVFTEDSKNIADILVEFGYATTATPNTQNGAQSSNSAGNTTSTTGDLPSLVSASSSSTTADELLTHDAADNGSSATDLPPLISASPSSTTNDDLPSQLSTGTESTTAAEDLPPPLRVSSTEVSTIPADGPPSLAPLSPEVQHTRQTSTPAQYSASAATSRKEIAAFKQPRRKVVYEKNFPREKVTLNEPITALMVSAADLDSIYVQSADRESLTTFLNVMYKLSQEVCEQKAPLNKLIEGEVVCGLDPISEDWDRVVILSYQPDNPVVVVRSVDYGSSYEVFRNDVRELTGKASITPMRAIKVKLSGLEGTVSAEGQAILESHLQQRVTITLTEKGNQLWCNMCDTEDNSINEALRPHTRPLVNGQHKPSQNNLDSHGSSSDGSIGASVTTEAPTPSSMNTSKESRIARLEEQLSALQMEKVLLQEEITTMRLKSRNTMTSKRASRECDDEFTL